MRSMTPLWPRMYQGVRTWPNGAARITRTRSPVLKRASTDSATAVIALPLCNFFHFPGEVVRRDESALEHGLREGGYPALVIVHPVISGRRDRFDVLPQFVDSHAPLAAGHAA